MEIIHTTLANTLHKTTFVQLYRQGLFISFYKVNYVILLVFTWVWAEITSTSVCLNSAFDFLFISSTAKWAISFISSESLSWGVGPPKRRSWKKDKIIRSFEFTNLKANLFLAATYFISFHFSIIPLHAPLRMHILYRS